MGVQQPTVFVSTLCYLIKLLQLFPICFLYTRFVALSTFVTLSIFRQIFKLLSFSHPLLSTHILVIYTPYHCTCCTHHRHNSFSCLIVRKLSAPMYLSNSPDVFGHRAMLIWGDRGMAGVSRRTTCYLQMSEADLAREVWSDRCFLITYFQTCHSVFAFFVPFSR